MIAEWIVHGRVQGVGFRRFTQREARRLGLRGWVRNEPDGTVRAHADGDDALVGALAAILRRGPQHSLVTALTPTEPTTPIDLPDGFVVLRGGDDR